MKPIKVGMKPIRVGHPNVEVEMNVIGVADLSAVVKMYEIRVKIKPIRVTPPDAELKMNETGLLNPNTEVKMNAIFLFHPDAVVEMPDIVRFDPNAEVKMVDFEGGVKVPRPNLSDGFVGRIDCFWKWNSGETINAQSLRLWNELLKKYRPNVEK